MSSTLFDIGPPKLPWSKCASFSALSVDWATPEGLYALLDREFHFDLDPCPLREREVNGLAMSWAGRRVFCNPPYGPATMAWLSKGKEAAIAVYLLPSRTDTRWWHKYAPQAAEVRFIRGRLKFGGSKESAPFPSVLLIFNHDTSRTRKETV